MKSWKILGEPKRRVFQEKDRMRKGRNPFAQDLWNPINRQKVIPVKTKYNRKKDKPLKFGLI